MTFSTVEGKGSYNSCIVKPSEYALVLPYRSFSFLHPYNIENHL
jgi:hypothetical protein